MRSFMSENNAILARNDELGVIWKEKTIKPNSN